MYINRIIPERVLKIMYNLSGAYSTNNHSKISISATQKTPPANETPFLVESPPTL